MNAMQSTKSTKNQNFAITFFMSSLVVFSFLFSAAAFAQTDTSTKTVDQMMQQIMSEQHVTATSQIECSKVTSDEFEQLGDAVMDRMMGSTALHEQMDAMMGGEGSQSLTSMHIAMGENWLGCAATTNFQGMMGGMMGTGGVMGGAPFNGGFGGMGSMMMGMMGYYYPAYYSSYNQLFIWTIIGWVLFVVMFVVSILLWKGRISIPKKKR
jgi:hypothetical protein